MTIRAAFNELFRPAETRAAAEPSWQYLSDQNGLGAYVDPDRASRHAVALRCIQVQAENLAAVPLNLYRRAEDGGRVKATDHPLHAVLHDEPSPGLTAFEAREFLLASLLVHGNAYARKEMNGRGQVTRLTPLDPRAVTVQRLGNGRLRYRITDTNGSAYNLTQDEVLHLRYRLDRNGVIGLSPLRLAAETMTTALAQSSQANAQANKGFRPSGALVFPDKLGKEQADSIRDKFRNQMVGAMNAGELMVLDGGVRFETFSIPAKDAEFLESRKLSNLDVARIYGVPPTVVGITDNATYSNADQESRALVVRCLAPLARRIEQAMTTALLPPTSRAKLFIEHDLSGLLRGDQGARYDAYRTALEWGFMSVNEVRQRENLPRIAEGDQFRAPLNMAPLGEDAEGDDG